MSPPTEAKSKNYGSRKNRIIQRGCFVIVLNFARWELVIQVEVWSKTSYFGFVIKMYHFVGLSHGHTTESSLNLISERVCGLW